MKNVTIIISDSDFVLGRSQGDWELFESKLGTPQIQEFFMAIDVDQSEAKGLFHLLDLDHSGGVSAEEFINGCLRLRGPAKALDLALLIQEVRVTQSQMHRVYHRLGGGKQRVQSSPRPTVDGIN